MNATESMMREAARRCAEADTTTDPFNPAEWAERYLALGERGIVQYNAGNDPAYWQQALSNLLQQAYARGRSDLLAGQLNAGYQRKNLPPTTADILRDHR